MLAVGCGDGDEASRRAFPPEAPPVAPAAFPELLEPPAGDRPWVRWWWPGGDVKDDELGREVDVIVDAGFGGAEIQAFNAGLDASADAETIARRNSYGSDEFFARVRAAMERADERGLLLDWTLGSGWPLASARYTPEQSLKSLMFREWSFDGPTTASLDDLSPQKTGMYHFADLARTTWPLSSFMPESAELVAVVAAQVTSDERDDDPNVLTDTVRLDASTVQVITDRVDAASGTLSWDVPAGDWRIVAFFVGADGSEAVDVAETGEILIADHLDADFIRGELEHLAGERTGLDAFYGSPFRGLFADSFEFKTDRHMTRDFLAEFEARRGYDPTPWLPAIPLPGSDSMVPESIRLDRAPEFELSADDERVRYDWKTTVSDLFIERFIGASTAWAEGRGLELRVQPYGMDIDVLSAAGAAHVPETEQIWGGGSELLVRAIASGAHLYGRPIVSAETLGSLGFSWTPTKLKVALDKLFGAGVNQVVLHGYSYDHDGDDYGEMGWMPFGSRHPRRGDKGSSGGAMLGERSVFWRDVPDVARYAARCQHLLRQGSPEADVLVYYPHLGLPNSIGWQPDHDEFFRHGLLPDLEPAVGDPPGWSLVSKFWATRVDDRVLWLEAIWPVLRELEARGFSWSWVNDERLAAATPDAGGIAIGSRRYAALITFDSLTLKPDAAESVAALAEGGAAVVTLGKEPARQPGFADRATGDQRVADAWARVAASGAYRRGSDGSAKGALDELGVTPAVALDDASGGVRALRRRLDGGGLVAFFRGADLAEHSATVVVEGGCADAYWIDPWTGRSSLPLDPERIVVRLAPAESAFLVCGAGPAPDGASEGAPWERRLGPAERAIELSRFELVVEDDVLPGGRFETTIDSLADWREIPGLERAGGRATYTTTVDVGTLGAKDRVAIDLGWLQGTAEVFVRGRSAGRVTAAPFYLDVSASVKSGKNQLRIEVTPPQRNRFLGLGDSGDPLYDHYAEIPHTSIATGWLGPATIRIGE